MTPCPPDSHQEKNRRKGDFDLRSKREFATIVRPALFSANRTQGLIAGYGKPVKVTSNLAEGGGLSKRPASKGVVAMPFALLSDAEQISPVDSLYPDWLCQFCRAGMTCPTNR